MAPSGSRHMWVSGPPARAAGCAALLRSFGFSSRERPMVGKTSPLPCGYHRYLTPTRQQGGDLIHVGDFRLMRCQQHIPTWYLFFLIHVFLIER